MTRNKLFNLLILFFFIRPIVSPRCDDSGDPNFCGAYGKCGASGVCQCVTNYKGIMCDIKTGQINDNNDIVTDGQMAGYVVAFILFFAIIFFLIIFFIYCLPKIRQRSKQKRVDQKRKDVNKGKQKKKLSVISNHKGGDESLIEMKDVRQVKKVRKEQIREECEVPIQYEYEEQSFHHKPRHFLDVEEDFSAPPQESDNLQFRVKEEDENQAVRLPSIYQKQLQAIAIHEGFRQDSDDGQRFGDHQIENQKDQSQYEQEEDDDEDGSHENYDDQNQVPIMIKQQSHQFDKFSAERQMSLEMSFIRSMKTKKNLQTEGAQSEQFQQKSQASHRRNPKHAFSIDEQEDYEKSPQIEFNPPPKHFDYDEPENLVITKSIHSAYKQEDQEEDEKHQLPGVLDSMGSGKLSSKNTYNFKSVVKHIRETTPEDKYLPSSNSSRGSKKLDNISLKLMKGGNSVISNREQEKKENKFIDQLFISKNNLGASDGRIELVQSQRKKRDAEQDLIDLPNSDLESEYESEHSIDSIPRG